MSKKKETIVRALYIFIILLISFYFNSLWCKAPFIIPFEYLFSGYIKCEYYGDSRQVLSIEPDDIPFFPTQRLDDPDNDDVNARGQTQFDAFETRLRMDMTGPKYKNFTIEGLIEADFEIFFTEVRNAPHLRHAYIKINHGNANITLGQTWHPMVFIEPSTINYNGSTPFDYYARSPQVRISYITPSNVEIMGVAAMQVDYISAGPYGLSSEYMRWAIIPNFHVQAKWKFYEHEVGTGVDFKRIAPRIVSDEGFKVHERLSSGAFLWYLGLKWPKVEIFTKLNLGQNVFDYNGLGGYAVKKDSTNPQTGQRDYVNVNNIAYWFDITLTASKTVNPGLFIGVAKNIGASHRIDTEQIYAFVPEVDTVFRISPRVTARLKSMVFSGEIEFTRANYGTLTDMAKVVNQYPVDNIRSTFAAYYYF